MEMEMYTTQWTTVTVYDVLPEDCRDDVAEKNVGDPAGDIYFGLKDMYLGVACPACNATREGCKGASVFDCNNPESSGNLVVRQIEVDVLLPYGSYELCNDAPGVGSCSYSCRSYDPSPTSGVGNQAVCGGASSYDRVCDMAPKPSIFNMQKWDYWNWNAATKMGKLGSGSARDETTGNGQWYSLVSEDENIHWRNASVVKVINAECQRAWLLHTIELAGAACFAKCASTVLNLTDPCSVGCIYDTVLGVNSGKSIIATPSGMDIAYIESAWLKGFNTTDLAVGGCPACPVTGPCPPPAGPLSSGAPRARSAPRRHEL